MAGSMADVGRTLTRTVTLPIVAATSAAAFLGIKTAAAMEQSTIAFSTFYGSMQAGEQTMRDLAAFAAATPFELQGLTEAAAKLAAVGVASEDLIPTMQGVGDAVAGVGGGAVAIDRVAFAMQQVIGQGRAMTQDVNQIAQTGIPIWGELAAQMGVGTEEIRKLAEQGKITDDVLVAAFTDPIGPLTKFSGLMESQSQTLSGVWSTFTDTISIELAAALQSALPTLKQALGDLTEAIGPALAAAGPAFAAVVQAAVPLVSVVADLLTWFSELSPEMQKWIVYSIAGAAAMGPLLRILAPIVSGFGGLARAVGGLARVGGAVAGFARAFLGLSKAFGAMRAFVILFNVLKLTVITGLRAIGLAFLTNPIGLLITGIAVAVAGVVYLVVKYWDQIKAAFVQAWEVIRTAVGQLWDGLRAVFGAIAGFLGAVWNGIVDMFRSAWDAISGVVVAAANFILGFLKVWFTLVSLPFRLMVLGIVEGVKFLWAVVSAVFSAVADFIVGVFQAVAGFVLPLWKALWAGVSAVASALWGFLRGVFSAIRDFIAGVWNGIKSVALAVWNAIKSVVVGVVSAIVAAIRDRFAAARDIAVSIFNALRDKVTAIWEGIKAAIKRVVDSVGGVVAGLWTGMKGVLNAGIRFINGFIGGVNKVIGAINMIPGAPDLPKVPLIPYLAAGGVVTGPTLAMVGEAGPEAVIPLAALERMLPDVGADAPEPAPIFLEVRIGDRDITEMIESVNRKDRGALVAALSGGRLV